MLDFSFFLAPKVYTQRVEEIDSCMLRCDDGRWGADVMISEERVDTDTVPSMVLNIWANSVACISVISVIDINIVWKLRLKHNC